MYTGRKRVEAKYTFHTAHTHTGASCPPPPPPLPAVRAKPTVTNHTGGRTSLSFFVVVCSPPSRFCLLVRLLRCEDAIIVHKDTNNCFFLLRSACSKSPFSTASDVTAKSDALSSLQTRLPQPPSPARCKRIVAFCHPAGPAAKGRRWGGRERLCVSPS